MYIQSFSFEHFFTRTVYGNSKNIVSLTKCPANSHTMNDGSKHDTCSISCIVINQLEQVHSPLWITNIAIVMPVELLFIHAAFEVDVGIVVWHTHNLNVKSDLKFQSTLRTAQHNIGFCPLKPNTSVMNKICTKNIMEQKMTRKISLRQGLRICPGKMSIIADVIVSRPENWRISPC